MNEINLDDPAFLKALMEAASARWKVTVAVDEAKAMERIVEGCRLQLTFAEARQ